MFNRTHFRSEFFNQSSLDCTDQAGLTLNNSSNRRHGSSSPPSIHYEALKEPQLDTSLYTWLKSKIWPSSLVLNSLRRNPLSIAPISSTAVNACTTNENSIITTAKLLPAFHGFSSSLPKLLLFSCLCFAAFSSLIALLACFMHNFGGQQQLWLSTESSFNLLVKEDFSVAIGHSLLNDQINLLSDVLVDKNNDSSSIGASKSGKIARRNRRKRSVDQKHTQVGIHLTTPRTSHNVRPLDKVELARAESHDQHNQQQQKPKTIEWADKLTFAPLNFPIELLSGHSKSQLEPLRWQVSNQRVEHRSDREEGYYSLNNRGSLGPNSTSAARVQTEWIPIVPESSAHRSQSFGVPVKKHMPLQQLIPTKNQQHQPIVPVISLTQQISSTAEDPYVIEFARSPPRQKLTASNFYSPPRYHSLRELTQYHERPTGAQSIHHYHKPGSQPPLRPAPQQFNHYWRRPRLNYFGPRQNKWYRRVLLCEKTLVSLDYAKMQEPYSVENPFDSDFDDNFIDLDSSMEPTIARAPENSQLNQSLIVAATAILPSIIPMPTMAPNKGWTIQNLSEASSNLIIDVLGKNGLDEMAPMIERRSMLSDEDPLIRCDMWDLDKGLKNRKPPREILRMAVRADFDTVRDAINRCRQLSEKNLPPDDEYRDAGVEIMSAEDLMSLFSMKRGLLPGTKWCGLGDQANNYNDLGSKHRIDICCRAHDHCPIRSKPFRNDYGVLNIALYTKSHCDCDADFYRCLREAHSRTADMLGNLYFNVMKLQCMREEKMKICREMKPIALGFERCIRYEESPVKTVFKFTTPPVAY